MTWRYALLAGLAAAVGWATRGLLAAAWRYVTRWMGLDSAPHLVMEVDRTARPQREDVDWIHIAVHNRKDPLRHRRVKALQDAIHARAEVSIAGSRYDMFWSTNEGKTAEITISEGFPGYIPVLRRTTSEENATITNQTSWHNPKHHLPPASYLLIVKVQFHPAFRVDEWFHVVVPQVGERLQCTKAARKRDP